MAELTKLWTFDANADGWTVVTTNGTGAYVASGGVTTGYINVNVTGRNKTDDGSWNITTTFEGLGIPAGSTITGYGLCSFYGRCLIYNVVDYARHGDLANTEGALFVNDGTLRSLIPSQASYTGTTAWAQFSNNPNITGLSLPSNTSITIHANHDIDLANNAAAQAQIGWDNISVTIIYTPPAQTFTDSITLTKSATTASQRILEALGITTISSSNTLSLDKTLDTLVSYILTSSNSLNTTTPAIINAILTLGGTYSSAIVSAILYAQGVYLSTTQDLGGTKQKQTIETWTDSQITWTTVQGPLPLETALEHAVVTSTGDIAWSPYTVILTGATNAAIIVNSNTSTVFLKYFDTTQNTVVTSSYTLDNIASLVSTLILDLGLNLSDQEVANLVTAVAISVDTSNTFEVAKTLFITKSLDVASISSLLNVATAQYTDSVAIVSIFEELVARNISVDTSLVLENLSNFVLTTILNATASTTFTKYSILGLTSEVFGQIVGSLVLNKTITQEQSSILIGRALLSLQKNSSIEVLGNFISTLSIELSKVLDQSVISSIIVDALVSFIKSTTIDTDGLAAAVSTLLLSKSLSTEHVSQLLSTVITTLSSEYNDQYVYEFIANVLFNISSSSDIQTVTSLISTIVYSLTQSYTFVVLPLGQTIEYLVLNTSISIEALNTLIGIAVLELLNTVDIEQVATFITTVVTNLTSNQFIEQARQVSKTSILTLASNNEFEAAAQVAAQVYLVLANDLDLLSSFELSRVASILFNNVNSINLSSVGNYIVATLIDSIVTDTYAKTAILNGNISVSALIRTLFSTLSANEARINLSYAIILATLGSAELFAALEAILQGNITTNVARVLFSTLQVASDTDVSTQNVLNTIASIAIDYDQNAITSVSSDLIASINLASQSDAAIFKSITVEGDITLNTNIQEAINRLGILSSSVSIQNIISLDIVKTAILNAGIDLSNLVVIDTKYGFDLLAITPDNRIVIIRVDNRSMTVTFEDRTKILTSEDRLKIIPGKS